MSKGITFLSYRLSSFTLYRGAFVQAQKESIPDRASVHAKKDDQVRPEKAKLRLGG